MESIATKVLIVGAGPVGMALAIWLKKSDIDFVIIDKRHDVTNLPRAIAINQSSLEIFDSLGILKEMIPQAIKFDKTYI